MSRDALMDALPPVKPMRGCFMMRGLYLKANGELPCWDDVGESRILRKLDPLALAEGRETNISDFTELRHIRSSFQAGKLPYPGLCETCAVQTCGSPIDKIDDSVLQVLHVEPSWMCHLSCPQCVPQKMRKSLKGPPWHMSASMFEGFLKQLRSEGISQIKLIIFEGRGDPLSCPEMEQLLALSKQYYPRSSTSITTHGSFPYKDWIASSKLDVMRFSVDGARQENYEKYRINGKLDKIFAFMEGLKQDRKADSALYTEWKYILFEWNDSDEELSEAAEIADRLGVQLRFCRTHTPGRSLRYPTAKSVAQMIQRLAPRALQDLTFQLKDEEDYSEVDVVRLDQIRNLMSTIDSRIDDGDEVGACSILAEIFELDGGIEPTSYSISNVSEAAHVLTENAHQIALPEVARLLAGFCQKIERQQPHMAMMRRFLELSPDAADHRHVALDLAMMEIWEAHTRGETDTVDRLVRAMASADAEDSLTSVLGRLIELEHPGVAVGMANVFEARGQLDIAALLFDTYLKLAPHASDYDAVSRHVFRITSERYLQSAFHQQRSGNPGAVASLAAAAVSLDGLADGSPPGLDRLVSAAESPRVVKALSELAAGANEIKAGELA